MAKKDFSGGLDALLGEAPDNEKSSTEEKPKKRGRKKSPESEQKEEIRATFIVDKNYLNKMKDIAYWDRKLIKNVLDEALSTYITKYEKANGALEPSPRR